MQADIIVCASVDPESEVRYRAVSCRKTLETEDEYHKN